MGLFDELLGGSKSAQPTSATPATSGPAAIDPTPVIVQDSVTIGANSSSGITMPTVDPMMVLNEQTTSTPPSLDDILNISAGNVTAEMPSYTERKAAEAAMSASVVTPVAEGTSPIVTPVVENSSPIITEAPAPVATTPYNIISETPVVPTILAETPVESAPTILSETPVEAPMNSLFAEAKTEAPEVISFEVKAETPVEAPVETPSLFNFGTEEKALETPASPLVETAEISDNSSLFGGISTEITEEKVAEKTPEISLESTSDFLAAGLVQLANMKKLLADRKEKYLAEAESYREQKEKFAELEKQAIENSRSMDDEAARIDSMEAYFKKQQDGANTNDSVNTALTGIAVQNAVGTTIEKKTSRKKTTEKTSA